MRKMHVVLAALAMLTGFGTAFTVDAASYRDIGTVAEGVYLLQGDGAFKVQATDAVTALVYDQDGAFLLAKSLGPGEARTFVVGDGAVAAILGGGAKVAARNEGHMMPLDTVTNVVNLANNQGPLDESYSIRLPPFLVGVSGKVQGDAQGLLVEVKSSKGLIYRFSEAGAETHLENLAAEVLDARITAEKLDGRIVLEVLQPDMGGMDFDHFAEMRGHQMPSQEEMSKHQAEAERHHQEAKAAASTTSSRGSRAEPAWTPGLDEVAETPVLLRFPGGGQASLDLQGGSGVDLSLYDASGAQVQYLQRGMTVAESRTHCNDFASCFTPMPNGYSYAQVDPEVVDWTLDPGTYLLYVRLAGADGTFAFQGLGEHFEVEPVTADGSPGASEAKSFDGPVLDFWVWDWAPQVQSEVQATLDGAAFYSQSTLLGLGGQAVQSEVSYDPSLLGAGTVEVLRGGLNLPTDGGAYAIVAAPPLDQAKPVEHKGH